MFITNAGQFLATGPRGRPPELLFGKDAPGTEEHLKRATRGSLYFQMGDTGDDWRVWMKVGYDGDASGDWQRMLVPMVSDDRYKLTWIAGERGKPGLNADIQNAAESTRMVTDPDFEILGTNASSDDVTFYAEGGLKAETDGASGDQVILLPHLDANQSAWTQVTWGTDKQVEWECRIKTGSAITDTTIWAGLKLTNTSVVATDNDQVFFRYQNGVNSGAWQAINSIGGTDDTDNTTVTVAADTEYHLRIAIDSSRIARFYINGDWVATSAALTDTTDLIPYIGIQAGAAAAKHMYWFRQDISRVLG